MANFDDDEQYTDEDLKNYFMKGQDEANEDAEMSQLPADDDQVDKVGQVDDKPTYIPHPAVSAAKPIDDPEAQKEALIKQYAAASDTSGIKEAQKQAAHQNFIANIGDALESLAKSNSMAHGGAGVDTGFYNAIKQQGQQGVQQAVDARQAAIQKFSQNNQLNHQVMQDMLTHGSLQQQQAAMKMQADMNDPQSQQSKNAQTAFKATFGKMPEVASIDVNKMSANDIHAASQELQKKAGLDNSKSNKELQLAYQKDLLKGKQDKDQDKVYSEANNKVVTPRGNTAVQQAQVGVASGQKALDILKQYPNPNTMPPEMVNLFTTEIAKVAAGGTPGEHGTAAVSANTFESGWNKFMEKVGGKPTGAQLGPFISQYKKYLDNMIDTNQKTIGNYEGQVYNGYKKRFTPEQDAQWKTDHPAFFQMKDDSVVSDKAKGEGKQQQATNSTIPASNHPQASQAEVWAKANPNDPRAAEILKRIGGLNAGL